MNVKSRTKSYQDTTQDPKDLYIEYLRKYLLSGFQYNQSACSPGILDTVQKEHSAMEGLSSKPSKTASAAYMHCYFAVQIF